MTETEFTALICKLQAGDQSVSSAVYEETLSLAYTTAAILLTKPEDIEDVLQNSYSKAFSRLGSLSDPANFKSWLKQIILNESKNHLVKQNRIRRFEVLRPNDLPIKESEIDRTSEKVMINSETRDLIDRALQTLSNEKRQCLELYYFDNLKIHEIAALLDLPEGTVKSRISSGKKALEKALHKENQSLLLPNAPPAALFAAYFAWKAQNTAVPVSIAQSVSAAATGTTAGASSAAAASAAGGTAAATATAAAAGGATAASGSIISGGLALKITAVAVAGAVTVGSGAAVKHQIEKKKTAGPEPTATVAAVSTPPSLTALTTLLQTVAASSFTGTGTSTSNHSTAVTDAETQTATAAQSKAAASKAQQAATTAAQAVTSVAPPAATGQTKPNLTTTQKKTTAKSTTQKQTTAKAEKNTTTTAEKTTKKNTTLSPAATTRDNAADYRISGGTLTGYDGNESSVAIPASVSGTPVTAIGAGAFSGNSSLRSVSIPSGVTQIGQEAFSDCTGLTSVSMPSTLNSIGIGAFYGCTSLQSVAVPAGVSSIGDEAFADCGALKTVKIPSSVSSIADDAFDGCDGLTIQCESGSAAESYAIENNLNYRLI